MSPKSPACSKLCHVIYGCVTGSVNCRFFDWPVKKLLMRTKVAIDDVPEYFEVCSSGMSSSGKGEVCSTGDIPAAFGSDPLAQWYRTGLAIWRSWVQLPVTTQLCLLLTTLLNFRTQRPCKENEFLET